MNLYILVSHTDFCLPLIPRLLSQSYHCRVRRQHKDADYDGGNSPEILTPLFSAPLDTLIKPEFFALDPP
jgi:hypothetical protein